MIMLKLSLHNGLSVNVNLRNNVDEKYDRKAQGIPLVCNKGNMVKNKFGTYY